MQISIFLSKYERYNLAIKGWYVWCTHLAQSWDIIEFDVRGRLLGVLLCCNTRAESNCHSLCFYYQLLRVLSGFLSTKIHDMY